jgi:hypothetical protein
MILTSDDPVWLQVMFKPWWILKLPIDKSYGAWALDQYEWVYNDEYPLARIRRDKINKARL